MKYHIEFDIEVPTTIANESEIKEWARYMVGDSGEISAENPLSEKSFDTIFGTFEMKRAE